MKATAIAPSNIAFIKYWGKKDSALRIPENGSLSMNLSGLTTTTTVEFSDRYAADTVIIDSQNVGSGADRIVRHLDRIRGLAQIREFARVQSVNSFPSGTGLSSSASGFAALTVAGIAAAGITLSEKQLSILARTGSGSACRSIPDGFVEWLDGSTDESSYAVSLHPPDFWDIADVVAVVSTGKKDVPTTEGQKLVGTSPFFPERMRRISDKLRTARELLRSRNFHEFGMLVEAEALELHSIMLTSTPSLIYWTPGTLKLMQFVKSWRSGGLACFFTVNTGQDIHILCRATDVPVLKAKLESVPEVSRIIINHAAPGARLTPSHLF